MLDGIIPHSPGRRKNKDGGIGGKQVEETERAKIYPSLLINRRSKTHRSWGYNMLQVKLLFSGFKVLEMKNHSS
jgi:hypothetical protein